MVVIFGFLFCVGVGIFAFGYMNKTSQIGTFIFGSMKSQTKVCQAEEVESNNHPAENTISGSPRTEINSASFIVGFMKSRTKIYIDDQPVKEAEEVESNHHLAENASSSITSSSILSVVADEDSRQQN